MFQLHDRTRRRVCLAAFVLLGVLPALLAGGWCLSRNLPGCAESRSGATRPATRPGRQTRRPEIPSSRGDALRKPGNLRSRDGQDDLPLPGAGSRPGNGRPANRANRGPPCCSTASQPEVEAASLRSRSGSVSSARWKALRARLDADLQLSAAELTLCAAEGSQTLTDVEGLIETLPGGTHAQLHFRLVGADTPEPARIRLVPQPPGVAAAERLRVVHRRRRVAVQRAGHGTGRVEAAGTALPFPRLHLGQRNARRLGRRSHRPTGRIGPRQPHQRPFSAPPERHRRGDDPAGPLPPRTPGRGQRHPRGRAGHDRPLAAGRGRQSLGPCGGPGPVPSACGTRIRGEGGRHPL